MRWEMIRYINKNTIFLVSLSLVFSFYGNAATFKFVDDGKFFSNTTKVLPVGGNMGSTLGEQRREVFKRVGKIWGSKINSNNEIVVAVEAKHFGCDPGGYALAAAGPTSFSVNFAHAPFKNTLYPIALANTLANTDLQPKRPDIEVVINASLGEDSKCDDWYYGLDYKQDFKINLLTVLLHELAHGFGFFSTVNEKTGGFYAVGPDVYSRFLYDINLNKSFVNLSDDERMDSIISNGDLAWIGQNVTKQLRFFLLSKNIELRYKNESFESTIAEFGPQRFLTNLTKDFVYLGDLGENPDACSAIMGNSLKGKIVLVDRGNCLFIDKIHNIQLAGGVAGIIANNKVEASFKMAGDDVNGRIRIPVVMVSQKDGQRLKLLMENDASSIEQLTMSEGTLLAGTKKGMLQVYTPSIYQSGSSVSHWTRLASPNLLMEPEMESNINGVDITADMLKDIGWPIF